MWDEKVLGEIINIKHGFAFKGEFFSEAPTSNILITPGNVGIGGGFKKEKFKYYHGPIPTDYILKEGDVLVTMTDLSKEGDTLGFSAKIPYSETHKFLHNQRLGLVKISNDEVEKDFIYWVLRTPDYQRFIVSSATGTTVRHTSPSRIKEYTFKIPPLPTQKAIAEILSSLDEKIELNNQINQNLEALAQALFKQWFVDFEFPNEDGEPYKSSDGEMVDSELGEIPKGWRILDLDSVATLIAGGDKPKNYSAIQTDEFKIPIYSNGISDEGLYGFTDNAKIKNESVTVSARGTIGFVCLRTEPYVPIVRLISVIPNEEFLTNKFLFLWLKNQTISGNGTTQQQLTIPDFKKFKILIPDLIYVTKITQVLNSFYGYLIDNKKENKELIMLRDTILPKLISGELEVNESLLEQTF